LGNWLIVYIGNLILYVSNLLYSPTFVLLVERRTTGKNSKVVLSTIKIVDSIGVALLIINFFIPLVFSVDENSTYQRQPFYILFNVIGVAFVFLSIFIYVRAKVKGGVFKRFPIIQFVIPIFIGISIQAIVYGISLIWPATAVGMTLMIISMMNQNILLDKLTGLYNRHYMEPEKLEKAPFGLIMMDLNNFKSINDHYGHSEGDNVLITTANLITKAIGSTGVAIRYAGDEFIVLVNTDSIDETKNCVDTIRAELNEYNKHSDKSYEITFSAGYGVFDLTKCNMDDVIQTVDAYMYQDKHKYYESHERRKG